MSKLAIHQSQLPPVSDSEAAIAAYAKAAINTLSAYGALDLLEPLGLTQHTKQEN